MTNITTAPATTAPVYEYAVTGWTHESGRDNTSVDPEWGTAAMCAATIGADDLCLPGRVPTPEQIAGLEDGDEVDVGDGWSATVARRLAPSAEQREAVATILEGVDGDDWGEVEDYYQGDEADANRAGWNDARESWLAELTAAAADARQGDWADVADHLDAARRIEQGWGDDPTTHGIARQIAAALGLPASRITGNSPLLEELRRHR